VNTAKGNQAVLFTFNGLDALYLGDYSGGFGIRYYVSDNLALRPGVDVYLWNGENKSADDDITDGKDTQSRIALNIVLEKHLEGPAPSISPFLGAGLGFSSTKHVMEPQRLVDPPSGVLLKRTDEYGSMGVFGVLGFEWGVMKSVTFGSEYRFGIQSSTGTTEEEREGVKTEKTADTSGFSLDVGTTSVYVSVGW
jgi:hypothetical protein